MPELENALAFIDKLVELSEALAAAIEVMVPLLPEPPDQDAMEADLEALMTATLGATNAARQFNILAREAE